MYDLTKWFLLPSVKSGFKLPNGQPYGIESHHLEGMNVTNNTKVYAYHNDTGKSMWFTKTPQGFPWDAKPYDVNNIFSLITESDQKGWSDPKNYKKEGWIMLPRFWDGDPSMYVYHQSAPWEDFNGCKQFNQGDVGPVYYKLEGPFDMDFGGNVLVQKTILCSYYWSNRKHREQLFLTSAAGWQNWTHGVFDTNINDYVIDVKVTHNQITPGVLTPKFPCFVIP